MNNTKKYRLFIFDLDGTLADTAKDVHYSMNQLRRQMDLPPISVEEAKKSIGPGPDRFVKLLTPNPEKKNLKKLIKKFRQIYEAHLLDQTKLFTGMETVLKALHDSGLTNIVVTNKPGKYSRKILDGLGVLHYFISVLGPEDVTHQKPAPEPILKALELAQVQPDEAIMIGDTVYDLQSAKAANVDICAVAYGYTPADELNSLKPNYFVREPKDILKVINKSVHVVV